MNRVTHLNNASAPIYIVVGMILLSVAFWVNTVHARRTSPLPESLIDNVRDLRGNNNVAYYFHVTGSLTGRVWGTGIYTDDSDLATAAVHAGVLGPGEKGVVKVTILPGQTSYTGSTANGITSSSYGAYDGSFRVEPDDGGDNPPIATESMLNLEKYREYPGAVYLFSVTADKDAGTIWGTNCYTDDSPVRVAAIHAGVLSDGQSGIVRVVIVPGQKSYVGTFSNGIQSQDYDEWEGSYMISNSAGDLALIPYPGGPENPLPAPYNLEAYKERIGGAYYFEVTGSTDGNIWGTDTYTSDSSLATAAVHAGVLSPGETGVVKVTILPGQKSYEGSTRNGVTSQSYDEWEASYKVESPDGRLGTIPVITSSSYAVYHVGETFTFQVQATNNPSSFNARGLPAGLSFDKLNGTISGTPEIHGRFPVEVLATNDSGTSASTLVLMSDDEYLRWGTECILKWAEAAYPQLFSPKAPETQEAMGFVFRYYSASQLYIGTYLENGHMYAYSPEVTHGTLVDLGPTNGLLSIAGCSTP